MGARRAQRSEERATNSQKTSKKQTSDTNQGGASFVLGS